MEHQLDWAPLSRVWGSRAIAERSAREDGRSNQNTLVRKRNESKSSISSSKSINPISFTIDPMASLTAPRPALRCWGCSVARASSLEPRFFSSAIRHRDPSLKTKPDSPSSQPPPPPPTKPEYALDPNTARTASKERRLLAQGIHPIGSRRRRAAVATSQNLPFEQLPYACFQEARKVLRADREDKLRQIEKERRRIRAVRAKDAEAMGGVDRKRAMLGSMLKYLERLKVLADVNDPVIKKRFEDGDGKGRPSDYIRLIP